MSMWMLTVLGTALGGALLVWHMVSRTKVASEQMLRQYGDMLAESRKQRALRIAKESAESEAIAVAPKVSGNGRG